MRWSHADLHLHTTCSDGHPTPERLARRLASSGLAVAAVTDHDTIEGALRVEDALAGAGPEIVIGSEVSSADGHVLALFMSHDVPAGLSARATIEAIHDQGGVAVAAHPFSLALGVAGLAWRLPFDGVEVVNGAPLMEVANARARAAVRRSGGGPSLVGGSDAHVAAAAGRVTTRFPGTGAADLRSAILACQTRPAVDWPGYLAALPAHLAWLAWLSGSRGIPLPQRSGPTGTPT
jgi:predicted metal-dependent phosphoesterase TrpH